MMDSLGDGWIDCEEKKMERDRVAQRCGLGARTLDEEDDGGESGVLGLGLELDGGRR